MSSAKCVVLKGWNMKPMEREDAEGHGRMGGLLFVIPEISTKS